MISLSCILSHLLLHAGGNEQAGAAVSPSIASEAPTSTLTEALFLEKVATKIHDQWMLFGLGLNLKLEALKAIKVECSDNSKLCVMHAFTLWRNSSSSPFKWETIIDVLRNVLDQRVLADELERQFLLQ